jgi:hypothetical protein
MNRGGEAEALTPMEGGCGDDRGELKPETSFSEFAKLLVPRCWLSECPAGASLRFFVEAVVKRDSLPVEPMKLPGQAERLPVKRNAL